MIQDFDFDVSNIGLSEYVIVKAGLTNDADALQEEIKKLDKIKIFSKKFGKGKNQEWAVLLAAHISEKDIIDKMTNIKEGSTLNTPKYNQDMCAAFLQEMDWKAHLENCRNYYREKLSVFLDNMQELFPEDKGITWTKPEGGLFLWATVPERIDTLELFYEAIKFKVAFVPGEVFYGEDPSKHHLRINFSYPSKHQLAEAVKRLADCLETYVSPS